MDSAFVLAPASDFPSAEHTQPREQSGLALVRVQPVDGPNQDPLHDLFGGVFVPFQPDQGEAVQPREIHREKLVECRLVAGDDAPGQSQIAHE